ncbi:hypothetical protein [Methanimicrococcus hacksteinii]|uniref:hypothetical protein n=1 Tax=Methanimicrococcus hacksteinii TaxID=3028293 RepID=UPI00298ED2ED|nr:hypothetical protein [Methanimicrococcus sp. At1]
MSASLGVSRIECQLHWVAAALGVRCIEWQLICLPALPFASSHFYHIRSLRERGHRLPYRFRLLLLPLFLQYSCKLAGLLAAATAVAATAATVTAARASRTN